MFGLRCTPYLKFVIDAKKEMNGIHKIAEVRDFPEVFPKDLVGICPDRKVEF